MDAENADQGSSYDWDSAENPLDRVAVSTLTTDINALIITDIDTIVHSNERVPAGMITPIVRRIKEVFLSPGTLYALLASRMHFQQESNADPSIAKLWRTRSYVCEDVAIRLIAEYEPTELAQCLVYEFYPLADGSALEIIPTWLRVSALELAIKSKAKKLLAHPIFVNIIADLWDGHLVLDPYVHKVHRSDQLASKHDLWRLMNARKGVLVRYDFETTTIFKPSRLRVPKYRDWLKAVNLAILVMLYVSLMGPSQTPQSPGRRTLEFTFQFWLVAFIVDEIQVFNAVGLQLYFMTLWSLCDFVTFVLGIAYLFFRDVMPAVSDFPQVWSNAAFDVLAVAGVTLIPRIFAILEASVGFSRTVISVRKMITELLWCWIAIAMFSVGFWAALAHFGRGVFSRTKVFYDLVQIMFGFTPAVWQTWTQYPGLGAMILFLYLFMAEFVVTTIVTAALSAKVVETKDNSLEEYHFLNAVRTELRIKSERQVLYFYSQPFNILGFFPLPLLRYMLPTRWYLRVNRSLLKLTHWHIFLAIYAYERLTSVILTRRAKASDLMHKRIKQHLRGRNIVKRTHIRPGPSLRLNSSARLNTVSPHRSRQPELRPELVPNNNTGGLTSDTDSATAPLLTAEGTLNAALPNDTSTFSSTAANAPPSDSSLVAGTSNSNAAFRQSREDRLAEAVGNGGSLREAKFELVEGLLNSPSHSNRAAPTAVNRGMVFTQPLHRNRRWSFESEVTDSIAPSEEFVDVHETILELRAANIRLEESYARLEESHVRLERMITKILQKFE